MRSFDTFLRVLGCLTLLTTAVSEAEDWPRWGGPSGDFSVPDPGLADEWPAEGLPRLWSQKLGEGHSAISAAGDRLFTLYSEGEEEVLVALDASSGDMIWSHRVVTIPDKGMRLGYGKGPHSTPTIAEDAAVFVGTTSILTVLEVESGKLRWQIELWKRFAEGKLRRGYGSSPLVYEGKVITLVGGDAGVVALTLEDGTEVWHQDDFSSAQSSPLIAQIAGSDQVMVFAQDEVIGLSPQDGAILWRLPHRSMGPYNISTPLWHPGGHLFVSSSYGGGARSIEITGAEGTSARSSWTSNRLQIHFTNAVRLGDLIVGSSGRSSVILTALEAETGELAWRSREIGRANLLAVGSRILALEEDGRLLLIRPEARGPKTLAIDQISESRTWTVPTLVGRTLYVRDRERIQALELPLAEERPRNSTSGDH